MSYLCVDAKQQARLGHHQLPAGIVNVRLVHVPDEQKRKELMIIYGEDVAPTGFTAMELRPGERGGERWPEIAKGVVERAQQWLKLTAGVGR